MKWKIYAAPAKVLVSFIVDANMAIFKNETSVIDDISCILYFILSFPVGGC